MNEKEKVEYLPLGSIVVLRGGTQKVVINGRGLVTLAVEPPCFFDYGGSLYPQGIIGDQILYFNHKDIATVVFEGYRDDDDIVMVNNINEWFSKSDFEKGNPLDIANSRQR